MVRYITTPLRYPGGKARALKKILPLIPNNYSEFREPLVGGGSVFIANKQKKNQFSEYKISDLNFDLICFWKELKYNSDEFIRTILEIKNNITDGRALYNLLSKYNCARNNFNFAVRFYILNRITFSGTVDSGGYSQQSFEGRFTLSRINELKLLSKLLHNVKIYYGDYKKLLFEKGDNVFIYLDPPYLSAKESKLYGKKGNLTEKFDHVKFSKKVKKCPHKWLITYDDSKFIRNLYDYAYINEWEMKYGMTNHNGKKHKIGKELFITNYNINNM